MTETEESNTKKPLGLAKPGKLELKKTVETGQVRQSFSHGRSKMVTVEVRKKRTYERGAGGKMRAVRSGDDAARAEAEAALGTPIVEEAPPARRLTEEEVAARARALEDAARAIPEPSLPPPPPRPEPVVEPEPEPAPEPVAEEPAAAQPEAEETPAEPAAAEAPAAEAETPAKPAARPAKPAARPAEEEDDEAAERRKKAANKAEPKRPTLTARKGQTSRRRGGKLTISEALGGREERTRSLASVRRAREKEKQKLQRQLQDGQKIVRDVVVPESITVQDLANRMAERAADVVKALMKMGVMATINQNIDPDTAELVVSEFGHRIRRVSESDVEIGLSGGDDKAENLKPRPPVVTVMGHVDHGKTSLLDALRETDVASGEAGGITQHIGAYQVAMHSGDRITFIDTPGHAAFTDMRARGARVTDIVVLVVAADDSVMPQTVEAIHHAKAAGVPIIVAINKMDRPDADAKKVRTQLLQHEIVVEEMGGDVLSVEVSAKTGLNLDKLEEAILLQAEILDLSANPDRPGEGVVVEAKMERGRGSVATVLVQRGTLKRGDIFVAGTEWGRVRALVDDRGNSVDEAPPGAPVEVLGLNGTPMAGDEVVVVDSEARAREVTEFRQRKSRDARAAATARGSLEQMFEQIREGEAQNLPMVIKADVHGSLEAIVGSLDKISTDEVRAQILHAGVGGINESDVILARASNALVIGFNVRANPQARQMARRDGVEIRYYSIIYDLTDDMRQFLSGMLSPTLKENLLGYAEIREVFNITKVGKVGGCMVTEGTVKRGAKVRLLRDNVVIHEGELSQLKRFKDDVREVKEGTECGMAFANYHDIQVGDFIECFEVEEVAREL
ncbi:MAG: translation initiation factor IF-2 [Hyphomicrobiales bacterium]|nr:translation initiation factor IF-2 [Hyphomicrobiales bacterium]MCP5370155.1 translation initiation factor IF-2 [Hyphomicrobiales bacterium]